MIQKIVRFRHQVVLLALTTVLVVFGGNALAHPGGLNKEGCHNNRKTGDYHCHRASSSAGDAISPSSAPEYSRELFGRGWSDTDGDCQNSRHEALIAQSTIPVRYKDKRQCQVLTGRWISPFTGNVIYDASQIDIDHVVPLKWAWEHGARFWSQERREQFANDPVNLWPVEKSLNRQKGAKGLDEWLPPSGRCQYASRFSRIVKVYGLDDLPGYRGIVSRVCN